MGGKKMNKVNKMCGKNERRSNKGKRRQPGEIQSKCPVRVRSALCICVYDVYVCMCVRACVHVHVHVCLFMCALGGGGVGGDSDECVLTDGLTP